MGMPVFQRAFEIRDLEFGFYGSYSVSRNSSYSVSYLGAAAGHRNVM